jgi:hypothetical protein
MSHRSLLTGPLNVADGRGGKQSLKQVAWSAGYRKPAECIQNPSQPKTPKGLSPESRASAPGCSLRSGDSKRAELFAEMRVDNVQQTAEKLSGAVHLLDRTASARDCLLAGFILSRKRVLEEGDDWWCLSVRLDG